MLKMSEKIDQVTTALRLAQKDFKKLKRNRANPFFKSRYADLDNCIDVTRHALQQHGLVIVQTLGANEQGLTAVTTMLVHTDTGQWIADTSIMVAKDFSPQAVGSAATYARRYGYSAITGIAPDDDDDGEAAMPRGTAQAVGQRFGGQVQRQPYPPSPKIGSEAKPQQTTIPGVPGERKT